MANHYQVLGIEPDATATQIKDAYRRAAMRWHPDRNRAKIAEAERRFKEVGAAYAVLSDPERRRSYDDQLRQAQSEPEDTGFDAEAAAEMFMREMIEMATAMAATGYNKDVLLGALLSQGVPASIASEIATGVIAARSKAEARAAEEQRAQAQRDRETEHRRQAAQRELEAREAIQRKDTDRAANTTDRTGTSGLWLAGVLIALFAITMLVSADKERAAANGGDASQSQRLSRTTGAARKVAPQIPVPGQLAVGARKANVRRGPGVRFPVVMLLSRGELVRTTNKPSTTSFIEIELANGKTGWIGQELLIDAAAARALGETTPEKYAESRPVRLDQMVGDSDLLNFAHAMSANNPANANPSAESLIATVRTLAPVSTASPYPRDIDALRYWTLEGRWQSDNGATPMEVVMTFLAAVHADPNDSGALVALGMAAMKAGLYGPAFDRVVRALTVAAPESTNTWVLLAASAAHRAQSRIARAALDVALGYSRDAKVTRAFIAKVASESPVPMVAAAFGTMDVATTHPAPRADSAAPGLAPGPSPQCSGLRRHSDTFDQQMSALVRIASSPGDLPRYTANQAVFVEQLCGGNFLVAQELIDKGKVRHDFAEQARKMLKVGTAPFRTPTSPSAS